MIFNPAGLSGRDLAARDADYLAGLPKLDDLAPTAEEAAHERELDAAYWSRYREHARLEEELAELDTARRVLLADEATTPAAFLAFERRAAALPRLLAEAVVARHKADIALRRAEAARVGRWLSAARADYDRLGRQRERAARILENVDRRLDAHGLRVSRIETEQRDKAESLQWATGELRAAERALAPDEGAPAASGSRR